MPHEVVAALIIRSQKILLGHRSMERAFYPGVNYRDCGRLSVREWIVSIRPSPGGCYKLLHVNTFRLTSYGCRTTASRKDPALSEHGIPKVLLPFVILVYER